MQKILDKVILETEKINKPSHIKRLYFWALFLRKINVKQVCEVGVYRGDFAEKILKENLQIKNYFMIDPWKEVIGLKKPSNVSDELFNKFYEETIKKTIFAKERIQILKGTTIEKISSIDDGFLDFIYLDGDHTLRGITLDLFKVWPKVKENGLIGGDDLVDNIWQSNTNYEPTLVFPYVIHFAEAMGTTVYLLPYNQFLITKELKGFKLINLSNKSYQQTQLHYQFLLGINSRPKAKNIKEYLVINFPKIDLIYKKILKLIN